MSAHHSLAWHQNHQSLLDQSLHRSPDTSKKFSYFRELDNFIVRLASLRSLSIENARHTSSLPRSSLASWARHLPRHVGERTRIPNRPMSGWTAHLVLHLTQEPLGEELVSTREQASEKFAPPIPGKELSLPRRLTWANDEEEASMQPKVLSQVHTFPEVGLTCLSPQHLSTTKLYTYQPRSHFEVSDCQSRQNSTKIISQFSLHFFSLNSKRQGQNLPPHIAIELMLSIGVHVYRNPSAPRTHIVDFC